jgi:hypothetical protein
MCESVAVVVHTKVDPSKGFHLQYHHQLQLYEDAGCPHSDAETQARRIMLLYELPQSVYVDSEEAQGAMMSILRKRGIEHEDVYSSSTAVMDPESLAEPSAHFHHGILLTVNIGMEGKNTIGSSERHQQGGGRSDLRGGDMCSAPKVGDRWDAWRNVFDLDLSLPFHVKYHPPRLYGEEDAMYSKVPEPHVFTQSLERTDTTEFTTEQCFQAVKQGEGMSGEGNVVDCLQNLGFRQVPRLHRQSSGCSVADRTVIIHVPQGDLRHYAQVSRITFLLPVIACAMIVTTLLARKVL